MIVHETIDGETILIHMGTGTYYSVEGAGSDIWNLAAAGLAGPQIAERIAERYGADAGVVIDCVEELTAELAGEDLLIPAPSRPEEGVELPALIGAAFVAPVLHRYTDMQEFMLVDPLHDVDVAAGWPHAAAG
jgi:Coenzyme PQQ synthesis protein D (PqqD)